MERPLKPTEPEKQCLQQLLYICNVMIGIINRSSMKEQNLDALMVNQKTKSEEACSLLRV